MLSRLSTKKDESNVSISQEALLVMARALENTNNCITLQIRSLQAEEKLKEIYYCYPLTKGMLTTIGF